MILKTKDDVKSKHFSFKNEEVDNVSNQAKALLESIESKKSFFIKDAILHIRKDIDKHVNNEEFMIDNYGYNNFKELQQIIKNDKITDRVIRLGTFIFSICTFILFILKFAEPPVIVLSLIMSFVSSYFYFSGKRSDIEYNNKILLNDLITKMANKKYESTIISNEYIVLIKEIFNEEEFHQIFKDNQDNFKYSNPMLIEAIKNKIK